MAVGSGIYITWITGAILISIAMMPIFKPPYAKVRIEGFIDMFRRYWAHMIVVFSVYLWKDILDGLDRILMANTQLDMTPYVYAIEGDIVLWVQEGFRNDLLDVVLTHFYVMGFMTATFASFAGHDPLCLCYRRRYRTVGTGGIQKRSLGCCPNSLLRHGIHDRDICLLCLPYLLR